MKVWQVQFWYPAVAILDVCGSLDYYPVEGKPRHAKLAGALGISPHESDDRVAGLFSMITDKHVLFLVKTDRSIKNEGMPMYYKISKSDFDHWAKEELSNLGEVVQPATESDWQNAIKFGAEIQAKMQKAKKAEAFFG